MKLPTFTCPFCETEHVGSISTEGEMPVGFLPQCDCPEFRADWEKKHRAEMERRKRKSRQGTPLTQVGRESRKKTR